MFGEILLTALALVFVIEGVSYALAPSAMRALLEDFLKRDNDTLRIFGLAAAAAGVVAIWLIRMF